MQGQKGVAHILILFILVVGLLAGLYLSQKTQIFKPRAYSLSAPILPTPAPLNPTQTATATFDKKILTIIFNPVLRNGQRLSVNRGWNNPDTLYSQLIEGFRNISRNRVNYSVVERIEVTDREFGWPVKRDGFRYDETSYINCIERRGPCHNQPPEADSVNFGVIFNTYDVCGKLNRDEIDELWLMGGPWFGFPEWEGAINPIPEIDPSCRKLLPIMGFNYERTLVEMYEDFAHRAEGTMEKVYGNWDNGYGIKDGEGSENTNWDKFSLLDQQKPGRGGCGDAHGAVNAVYGLDNSWHYDRTNRRTVSSQCDDFLNYPNLTGRTQPVSCQNWGCKTCESAECANQATIRYFEWWFGHLPHFQGIGPDGKLNDWWSYIFDPNSNFTFNSPGY